MKQKIFSIQEKNRIVERIRRILMERDNILIIGHENPDDDCVSTMVAIALVLRKFGKKVSISTDEDVAEEYSFLHNICRFNFIYFNPISPEVFERTEAIFICDTPKPSMVYASHTVRQLLENNSVIKVEIDHHLEADSDYNGDPGYCLVDEASSASELVGYLGCKLRREQALMEKFQIEDLFTRNVVLAILTGMIGDTQMGKFIKTRRERKFYDIFIDMFNQLLASKTVKDTNFASKEEVFEELQRLSDEEEACFNYMMGQKRFSQSVGYVVLSASEMDTMQKEYDNDTVVTVARSIADVLAEESGKISLVAYYDYPEQSNMIQFRARRSHEYSQLDLREMLKDLNIENGGGHPGAIGFRFEKDSIEDIDAYVSKLIAWLEEHV